MGQFRKLRRPGCVLKGPVLRAAVSVGFAPKATGELNYHHEPKRS
jgi:hypothetical protein